VQDAPSPAIFVLLHVGPGTRGDQTERREGERVQYQEFIDQVRQRAEFASFERAEETTQAILTTLGEYLTGGEANDLAAQLPQGLAEYLRRQPPERSELFSLEDFLQEVGEREGVNVDEARAHARAVMGVLEEAVTEGEMEDVRRQFPSEFDPLFGEL
jgi:uncharacterized protein (DUF2267 family)